MLVLCNNIHGNELCQIDLIKGAPYGLNLSLFGLCLFIMGKIYVLLIKKQLDRVLYITLFNEKYVPVLVS